MTGPPAPTALSPARDAVARWLSADGRAAVRVNGTNSTHYQQDPAVSGADAARARGLGFAGKICIHPTQVGAVNAAFSPTGEGLAWAHRIVEASTAHGAVRVDAHMVDAPVIRKAQTILARAKERA